MSSHSLNTRAHTETTHEGSNGPPKTKNPSRANADADARRPTLLRAPRRSKTTRAAFFCARFHRFASKRAFATPLFLRFLPSRVALHQAPPKRAKEKRAQKKSRDTAYKMPREQRDRERERANGTRERKEEKKADANHARLAIVEVVCRFFPSRRARRLPMSRERDFLSCIRTRKKLREGRHFETLNDNS